MSAKKSKDFDVRSAVVARLLEEGMPRQDIRHEITLDTASSGGRADIVLLHDDMIRAIEVKSDSDRLDRLSDQLAQQGRSFDYVVVVAGIKHREARSRIDEYFCMELGFVDIWQRELRATTPSFRAPRRWGRSNVTSTVDVARLMWRDEAVRVAAKLGCVTRTREKAISWMRENVTLRDLRPLVVAELRGRVPNRWEDAFWQKFDAQQAEAA